MAALNDDRLTPQRPAVDEWGIYDPQQAGLAALYARLDTLRRLANTPIDGRALASKTRDVLNTPVDARAIAASMREFMRLAGGKKG
ncbi:MAG: hypothetical protein LC791_04690 [Acidobacteria bacterium]|nr:hypothetical protein [Acidobacteriota bacterium]